ncbi:hypothetical protein BH09PLA1_BH09PLA1_20290 [soil metagenome]
MGLFSRNNSTNTAVPAGPKPITKEEAAAIASPPGASVTLQGTRTSMVAPAPPTERQM